MSEQAEEDYPDSPDDVEGQDDERDDLFPDRELEPVDEDLAVEGDDNDDFDESALEDEEL